MARHQWISCSEELLTEAHREQVRKASGDEAQASITRTTQPYASPITRNVVQRGSERVGLIRVQAFNARTRAEIADAISDMQARVLTLRDDNCKMPSCELSHASEGPEGACSSQVLSATELVHPCSASTCSCMHTPRSLTQLMAEPVSAYSAQLTMGAVVQGQGVQRFELDLRDNLGGLFQEGVEVARLFLGGALHTHVVQRAYTAYATMCCECRLPHRSTASAACLLCVEFACLFLGGAPCCTACRLVCCTRSRASVAPRWQALGGAFRIVLSGCLAGSSPGNEDPAKEQWGAGLHAARQNQQHAHLADKLAGRAMSQRCELLISIGFLCAGGSTLTVVEGQGRKLCWKRW